MPPPSLQKTKSGCCPACSRTKSKPSAHLPVLSSVARACALACVPAFVWFLCESLIYSLLCLSLSFPSVPFSLCARKHSRRATHRLTPRDDGRTVDVQFKQFGIGWLRVPAPASARGILETTYLDESLRVSRGVSRACGARSNARAMGYLTHACHTA